MSDLFELSTLAKEYAQLIRASRQQQMQLDRDTVAHVLGLLQDTLAAIQKDIQTIPRGILTSRYRRQMERSIEQHVARFGDRFKTTLDGGIVAAAKNISDREAKLLSGLTQRRASIHPEHALHVAVGASQIGIELGKVPKEVLDRLYAKVYPDGLKLSQRLYNLDRDARRAIGDAVFAGVTQGHSARKVAAAIEPLMTTPGVDNIRFKSLRIARTEINSAYREGHIASVTGEDGKLKPWISAIGWRLSPSHPRIDICDAWAGDDTEGLGAGNYSPENVPPGHPFCLCFTVTILEALPDQQFVNHAARPDEVPTAQRKYYGAGDGLSSPARQGSGGGNKPPVPPGPPSRAVSAAGAAPMQQNAPASVISIVRAKEDQIRPQRFESAFAIDRHGTVILDKNGAATSVSFDPAEMSAMKAGDSVTLTHNHPLGWNHPPSDPEHVGNSFSEADIRLAVRNKLAEIRAITPVHRYSMKAPPGGWPDRYWEDVLKPIFDLTQQQVRTDFGNAIRAGTMTIPEAEAQHYHELWSRISKALNLDYTQETS